MLIVLSLNTIAEIRWLFLKTFFQIYFFANFCQNSFT